MRFLQRSRGTHTAMAEVIDLSLIKAQGALVEHRSLEAYEKVTP